ncbi:hypothetical protein OK351_06155 [Glutamicibacter sp. MNS18]|uniref:hypothetical protein n=1 Tax=Glutamicibacter sp. MNS18 TaxID=2989817 RepID=UPI002235C119|nr:hypothetical protein [Glutamicibacter sp. MNS18]MCW4465085.1 hypothetical protein [Glutamicibacter sp. MNS18]
MHQPAAAPQFPGTTPPVSEDRRRFRALARSAPWLSTSLRVTVQVPTEFARAELGLEGEVTVLLRGREAIAISGAEEQLLYQRERFTTDRGLDYVAASASSWALPASLVAPVFSDDHLVQRRPAIQGFGDLLPLPFLESLLDPFELAGEEPASLELAFDHPTFIHELRDSRDDQGREVVQAVLSAGHSYRPTVPESPLVPPGTRVLVVLDRRTGVLIQRTVLSGGAHPDFRARILARNEYYIDSLFTAPVPTLVDVRKPRPWTLRAERGTQRKAQS